MLAGAIQQYLRSQGIARVSVGILGDVDTGGPAVAVHAEPGNDAELDGGTYNARVMIRARGNSAPAAETANRSAMEALLAADGSELSWTDPTGGPDRTYRIEAVQIITRPTWYATPEPGEETSANLRLFVTET